MQQIFIGKVVQFRDILSFHELPELLGENFFSVDIEPLQKTYHGAGIHLPALLQYCILADSFH